jgi:ligand-binding sensor domain-containing protein
VRIFQGARVTAELGVGGRAFVGTATAGVWLDGASPRRLTPEDQICSNEIVATERFAGRLWFASFDEGLCSYDGRSFRRARLPADMMNDLVATPKALFAASTRGLFRTRDGERWERVGAFDDAAVVDLAFDGRTVWAVTPGALWEIPVGRRGGMRRYGEPGGARALQAVDVRGGRVWLASEDRGALRMTGKRFEIFDRAAGLPSSWSVDVAATPDGGAYVATLRHGLVRIEPDGRAHTVAAGEIDRWLLHVRFDEATGGVWVGTQSGAAWLTAGGAPTQLLGASQVHVVLPTPAGVWIGTDRGTALVPPRS